MTASLTGLGSPRDTLTDVVSALDGGPPVAVVDPAWPRRWREQITEALVSQPVPGDVVVFSSGSVGRPRGIIRTAASWSASHEALAHLAGINAEDTVWLPLPLTSTLSLYGAVHTVAIGARPVLAGQDESWATAVHTVPAHLSRILDRRDRGELPHLRVAIVAGDHLGPSQRVRAQSLGISVVEYYGAAELSFVAIDPDGGGLRPFPGADIEVRSDDHIWVRSPYLAAGYLAGADAAEGDPGPIGPLRRDGAWATVGDRGRWLDDSPVGSHAAGRHLVVEGRGDLVVTTAGHTVQVEQVEAVLRTVTGVDDVVVTGRPHEILGSVLVAAVAGTATDTDLRAALADLPPASRPRRWVRVESVPRTPGGKIRRDLVQALVNGGR